MEKLRFSKMFYERKQKKPNILDTAFYNYRTLSLSYRLPFVVRTRYVCDNRLRVGIDIGNYVLAASAVIFGNMVSVNEKVWKCRKPIILYVGEAHAFYLVKQKEVKEPKTVNFEKCTMVNFDIHSGVNLNKLFPEYTQEEKEKKMMGF